jgi:hypothetical protein
MEVAGSRAMVRGGGGGEGGGGEVTYAGGSRYSGYDECNKPDEDYR